MSTSDEPLSTRDLAATPEERERERDAREPEDGEQAAAPDAGEQAARGEPEAAPDEREGAPADDTGPLLPERQGSEYMSRWEAIQVTFVDDPRHAVEEADALVATVMQQLADGFAHEREGLEGQWSRGEDVSTEDLRVALQRYRSFFRRLLSA
jgi:hypothetical protein